LPPVFSSPAVHFFFTSSALFFFGASGKVHTVNEANDMNTTAQQPKKSEQLENSPANMVEFPVPVATPTPVSLVSLLNPLSVYHRESDRRFLRRGIATKNSTFFLVTNLAVADHAVLP
jgi:hypothetical protein